MHVVAMKPVRDRRLRRDGFDCRMTIDAGHRGVKARIRNAVDADPAVVVRHVLNQPIDGVVGVGGLVDLLAGLVGNVRPHVFVLAFAHVAPAHVLIDKDVAFAREQFIGAQRRLELIRAVGRDAVTACDRT